MKTKSKNLMIGKKGAGVISKFAYGILMMLALMLPFITLVTDLKVHYPDIQGNTDYTNNLTADLDTSLANLNQTTNDLYNKITNPEESTALDITFLLAKTVTKVINIIVIQLPKTAFLWVTTILGITGLSESGRLLVIIIIAILLAIVFWIIRVSTRADV